MKLEQAIADDIFVPSPKSVNGIDQSKRKLNLGSGKSKIADTITIDRVADTNPDVVHDLDVFPWPFENGTFETIYCFDVIEHLRDIVKAMEEMHRIARNGARIHIATPHFSCANSYTDPTHIHHLGYFSFNYFTGENQWDFYTRLRFKKIRSHLHFYGRYKNLHISWLANRYPNFYEEHLTWIFPAWYMSFELEVVK